MLERKVSIVNKLWPVLLRLQFGQEPPGHLVKKAWWGWEPASLTGARVMLAPPLAGERAQSDGVGAGRVLLREEMCFRLAVK